MTTIPIGDKKHFLRLRDAVNTMLNALDPQDVMIHRNCPRIVKFDMYGIASNGTIDVQCELLIGLSLEAILALAGEEAKEVRAILNEIRNRPAPAPRKKTKRAPSHG